MAPRQDKLQESVHIPIDDLKTQSGDLDTGSGTSSLPPPPPGSDQSTDNPIFEPGPSGHAQSIGVKKVMLPCTLTPDEKISAGIKLAQSFHTIQVEKERQRVIREEMNAAMKKILDEQAALALAVETGEERRLVDVDYVMLGDGETISEVRKDTMKPIATRPATDFERQGSLFPDTSGLFPDDLPGEDGENPEE